MEEKTKVNDENKLAWAKSMLQMSKEDYIKKCKEVIKYDVEKDAKKFAEDAYKNNKREAEKILKRGYDVLPTEKTLLSKLKHLFGKRKPKANTLENNK